MALSPLEARVLTEAEARAALRAFGGGGEIEPWISDQPWQATRAGWTVAGWTVAGELQGWRFRLEAVPGGVRVLASDGRGEPTVWFVPSRRPK